MNVFDMLRISPGDYLTVDNPRSNSGPRDVVPLGLSKNGISIRAIDTRYGNICYIGADWTIFTSKGEESKLGDIDHIKQSLLEWKLGKLGKKAPPTAPQQFLPDEESFEVATLDEILETFDLKNLKVAVTGTLPIPRKQIIQLLET
ncbi:hypothetical protein [Enterovibrio nigricans]|uniref:DNA ligase (NAD+) n=1 Tax=Enterovibrio nigricans DSM 22720 TaxID=1121868 RepID=A0A1T4U730_9GAMM|nr:hypothetical protein [Enterovibrio nigricans]PKF51710.1 DNA ligase [Enterovibrio nigricans]SKA48321.1 DNA ligase (NAD+) [Enterovibrio nigricans DSM 22720]